jgi:hypothetical protein
MEACWRACVHCTTSELYEYDRELPQIVVDCNRIAKGISIKGRSSEVRHQSGAGPQVLARLPMMHGLWHASGNDDL